MLSRHKGLGYSTHAQVALLRDGEAFMRAKSLKFEDRLATSEHLACIVSAGATPAADHAAEVTVL